MAVLLVSGFAQTGGVAETEGIPMLTKPYRFEELKTSLEALWGSPVQ